MSYNYNQQQPNQNQGFYSNQSSRPGNPIQTQPGNYVGTSQQRGNPMQQQLNPNQQQMTRQPMPNNVQVPQQGSYSSQGLSKPGNISGNVGNAEWGDYFSQTQSRTQQPQQNIANPQTSYTPNQQATTYQQGTQQNSSNFPVQRQVNPQQQPIINQLQMHLQQAQQLQQQQQQQQQQQFSGSRGVTASTAGFPQQTQQTQPQQQGYNPYQSAVPQQNQPQISPVTAQYNPSISPGGNYTPAGGAYNPTSVYDPFGDTQANKTYNPNANVQIPAQSVYQNIGQQSQQLQPQQLQSQQQQQQYSRNTQTFPGSTTQQQGWQQGRLDTQSIPQTNNQVPYNSGLIVPSNTTVGINPISVPVQSSLQYVNNLTAQAPVATSRSARWSTTEANNPVAAATNVALQKSKASNYLSNIPSTYSSNINTASNTSKSGYVPTSQAASLISKYSSTLSTSSGRDRTSNTSSSYSTTQVSSNYKGKNPRPFRSRSRSPVKSKTDNFVGSKRRAPSRSPVRDRSINKSNISDSNKKIDYSTISPSQLIKDCHTPSIGKFNNTLSIQDLLIRFPDLYIPADFVKLDMDWHSILYSEQSGVFTNLPKSASFMFENNPAPLEIDSIHPGYASMLEPPKFTYLTPESPLFNKQVISLPGIVSSSSVSSRYLNLAFKALESNIKPVKFNARVIVSLGFKENETERIDHHLTRKLRVLIGRRKGSVMLLGSSWSKELDGGDPLIDRSCLLQTARRAVKAQSLLDISDSSTCLVTKLCELSYHRPQEEFKGKTYPEQDEITAIYLCCVHNPPKPTGDIYDDLNYDNFVINWKLYLDRCNGKGVAPTLNGNDIDFNATITDQSDMVFDDNQVETNQSHGSGEANEDVLNDTEDSHAMDENADKQGEAVSFNEDDGINNNIDNSVEENVVTDRQQHSDDLTVESSIEDNENVEGEHDNKQQGNNDSTETNEHKDSEVANTNEEPSDNTMPKSPCVLLCPQPLPKDLATDSAKKSDAISLRVLPLSSILSYSQDDSNERIFEASLASELLQSVIALTFSNIITDFLLSEHKVLNYIVDPRISLAVKTLRKFKPIQPAVSNDAITNNKEESNKVLKVNDGDITKSKPIESNDGFIPFSNETKDIETTNVTKKIDFLEISPFASNPIVLLDNAPAMSLEDAKNLHKDFLSACRWFDITQDHYLRLDHLQLILYSSYRDISRADITALAWDICKDEKFKYDSHF